MSTAVLQDIITETGTELLARLSQQQCSLQFLDTTIFPRGFQDRTVVEVSGSSGVGKSQLLMHFIVRCIVPKTWKNIDTEGLDVGVILIDNNHNFPMLRLISLLESKLKLCLKSPQLPPHVLHEFVNLCLKKLLISRCSDSLQLMATLQQFNHNSSYIYRGFKILIIDSLFAFYWEDLMMKTRTGFELKTFYRHLATVIENLREGFAVFYVKLSITKSIETDENNCRDNDAYYPDTELQKLVNWKLNLTRDNDTNSSTITVKHSSKCWKVPFKINETGFNLKNI